MLVLWPVAALLIAAAAATAAAAGTYTDNTTTVRHVRYDRSIRGIGAEESHGGCLSDGRWHRDGGAARARDPCLRCTCRRGALACTRRACSPPPDPPPRRCHVLHRRDSCCPELHCADGVTVMEREATSRLEPSAPEDAVAGRPPDERRRALPACVEGGTVFAAGSALSSSTACEQCFCLGGARRCVRPRCLPPPPGCRARPAPGACCPPRYYCDADLDAAPPPDDRRSHDCVVDGALVAEGERAVSAETNCTQCFCLRGAVRCQPLGCAPPLLGCRPLLHPGQCCPHQYHCDRPLRKMVTPYLSSASSNALVSLMIDDRSFHTSKSSKHETTTITSSTSTTTNRSTPTATSVKEQIITTAKVKRKTNEPPPSTSHKPVENITTTITTVNPTTSEYSTSEKILSDKHTNATPVNQTTEKVTTEQPEGSVKIVINETINCTAELSSTSLPINVSVNDTNRIKAEVQARVPLVATSSIEAQTFSPNDIITDRNVDGGFDENDSFVINVTSSLMTNTSRSTAKPSMSTISKTTLTTGPVEAPNISKKTKGDYDYDYTEPTLPPSLPNLKIIPFVAADAVVDDISSKDSPPYSVIEREDKYPVYYPIVEKKTPFATRREDVIHTQYLDRPTQYPVYTSEEIESVQYPSLTHEAGSGTGYSSGSDALSLHEYTMSTSVGNQLPDTTKTVTKTLGTSTVGGIESPSINLFSPPIETEGGFIPKGPGIIDEYYAVYPSTPSGPAVPHLTTSMQLDITKEGECISSDGRRIPEGDTISLACSVCSCSWGELHCAPRPCHTPAGCQRRPASSSATDLCCGELLCTGGNNTTPAPVFSTRKFEITLTENKITINHTKEIQNDTELNRDTSVMNTSHIDITKPTNVVNVQLSINNTQNETEINREILNHVSKSESSTEKLTTITSTTVPPTSKIDYSETSEANHSVEYDDEEEEDEGFSFGSVLKLLLSDSYDATTTTPRVKKISTTTTNKPSTSPKATTTLLTTLKPPPRSSVTPFIPMPSHYAPPKKSLPQNGINRIDHLVLGEATAIKKSPAFSANFRPVSAPKPVVTQKPPAPTKAETNGIDEPSRQSLVREASRSPGPGSGVGPGLLKLAGCNIYGRMYRVGGIIAELSTPCQECRCTELGVQCRPLAC